MWSKRASFLDLIKGRWNQERFVCLGLNADLARVPRSVHRHRVDMTINFFNLDLIEATKDVVAAYSLDPASYHHGDCGTLSLMATIRQIQDIKPGVPVILDANWGGTQRSSKAYAQFAFETLGVDAITVHPFYGGASLLPFLDFSEKGIFLVCRTAGGEDMQEMMVSIDPLEQSFLSSRRAAPWTHGRDGATTSLANHIAYRTYREWNKNGNCGLVCPLVSSVDVSSTRKIAENLPILLSESESDYVGINDRLQEAIVVGTDKSRKGIIVVAPSKIIFHPEGHDFAQAVRNRLIDLNGLIVSTLGQTVSG